MRTEFRCVSIVETRLGLLASVGAAEVRVLGERLLSQLRHVLFLLRDRVAPRYVHFGMAPGFTSSQPRSCLRPSVQVMKRSSRILRGMAMIRQCGS